MVVWYNPLNKSWFKGIKKKPKSGSTLTKEQALNLLNPNKEENTFIEIAPYVIFFKDWRDDLRRKFSYTWHFIFEAVAKHFFVNVNELGYLTVEEIKQALKDDIYPENIIKERKEKGCVVTSDEANDVKVINNIPLNYKEIIEKIENSDKEDKEVKGQVAYPGKVSGSVRIMRTYHDIKKVEFGDILIANTTHPNYLPAMQKSAAFITNEGGVVSHAAIVAREMKKPCIVGTKIATKVFKDYDLVEVDANKGIVRKL